MATGVRRTMAEVQPASLLIAEHSHDASADLLGDRWHGVMMPGIPMLYAGDEIGQAGENGEDGRRPFPWHRESDWNVNILDWVRAVFRERNSVPALRTGGLRWVSVTDDALTFLREAGNESILVHATRASSDPVQLPAGYFGRHLAGLAGTVDVTAAGEQLTLPSSGPGFDWWRLPPTR